MQRVDALPRSKQRNNIRWQATDFNKQEQTAAARERLD
jgi:hypothetical protein